jgi:SSS family solute:Na+ symporter
MEVIPSEVPQAAVAQFNTWSWVIIGLYLAASTWLGHYMAGKQATMKDFFLGGRRLPWAAVSGSIIATEISAMTIVAVPAYLWAETGNMTYGVLAIGNIIGRILVGLWFVPAWYKREIYSPYDYIGHEIGKVGQRTTSVLFMIGGMLAQSTRVLLTAIVLEVMTGIDVYHSILLVGAVAILWTFMGGITTVIWTDVVQFFVFLLTAVVTVLIVTLEIHKFGIPMGDIWRTAWEQGKMVVVPADMWYHLDLRENFTLLTGVIAVSIGGLASYGTDQLMVQRAFCCRGEKEAFKAIAWSSVGQVVMFLCLLAGVAVWYFYKAAGLPDVPMPEELVQINENPNRLIPVFVKYRVNWLVGGLIVAGIFAAAISSLDSILAALAEQTMSALKNEGYTSEDDPGIIFKSRIAIIGWGIVLTLIACTFKYFNQDKGVLLDLALSLASLTAGGILGSFLISFVPGWKRDSSFIPHCAGLSILTILALVRHEPLAGAVIAVLCILVIIGIVVTGLSRGYAIERVALKVGVAIAITVFILALNRVQYSPSWQFGVAVWNPLGEGWRYLTLGWPWYTPLGVTIMVIAALLICDKPRRP